jgi:hypothetical protein
MSESGDWWSTERRSRESIGTEGDMSNLSD